MKESKLMLDTRFVFPDRVKMRDLDEETLEGLKASIKAKGQKQPISVRPIGQGAYKVNFGEHRLEACKQNLQTTSQRSWPRSRKACWPSRTGGRTP